MKPAQGLKTAPSRNRDAAMKQYFLIGSDDRIQELPEDRTVMIGRSAIWRR